MIEKILTLFTSVIIFCGCSGKTPEISMVCLCDDIGNYIIKWETNPHMDGTLKMYVSDDPMNFNKSTPALYANLNHNVATFVTNDNITRKYFLASFNDKYYKIIGSRAIEMDSIQNFRDMGGYRTANQKHTTQWGKVFRSGQLSTIIPTDSLRLDKLGIKTIIDLRSREEATSFPICYSNANIVHIPVEVNRSERILERLKAGQIRKGDGVLFMQDMYLQFLTEDNKEFSEAIHYFLDPDNYPVLFSCALGKDRAGFLGAMILAAIGVPEETILRDYTASNLYIDIPRLAYMAKGLNTDAQETFTTLLSTDESYMELLFQKIKKDYGSVDKYLTKCLNLTENEQDRLKELMLY